jgi:benzylsuccinate CoA-transferase BbsF subunit
MKALEGVKVLDFSWVILGPMITHYLAIHGAAVIRIESKARVDPIRVSPPYKDRKPGINRAGYFAFFNANKLSMALNLNHLRSREVLERLIRWADVVVENFTPGMMEKWGLGYEDLKKIKPDIIMLRTSNLGQTGPLARRPGFGHNLVALLGFSHLTGWPDGPPQAMGVAYSDVVTPRFGVAALVAALVHRRKTGKGQMLDLSQMESSLQFLAPLILDYTVNHRESNRRGNFCPYAAPHGVYPCRGDDRWCAITVFTDDEWRGFCKVIGHPEWTQDLRFKTLLSRKRNEAELDRLVEIWTINFSPQEVMERMQKACVPCGIVSSSEDIFQDPQLKGQEIFWKLDHPEIGPISHLGQPFILSETPAAPQNPAPCLGEHTEYVCTQILGFSDKEFLELFNGGVFE